MTGSKEYRGADLLRNPQLNRGDAFTQEERSAKGLRGLLPPVVSSTDAQVERMHALVERFEKPLDKFLFLDSLHESDENLFYKLLIKYIDQYMPIVYTPTVGEVCQNYSNIFRYPRGAYISINDLGHVREIIDNVPNEEVDVIVVTDGQRILGLGDLGLNGMGIPCGKLSLYVACAGIDPAKTLPVVLDVGTNTERYLKDPQYLGLRRERETGPNYDALLDEFINEARRRWPNVLIQFEDFGNNHAFDILARYQKKILCFNDDIQGTASVAVSGMYSAMRILKKKLGEQKFLFLGAGEAATGIAHLIVDAMVEEGMDRAEAFKHCMLFDSKGLVTTTRGDKLRENKVPFAQDLPNCKTFAEAVRAVRPTGIIGVSAQPGAFTPEVLREMAKINERPIIFALSNPTSRAECDAATAYRETDGRALFASGSPFGKVEVNGRTFVPRQGNNSYVFPGLGMGAVFARAKWMPTGMFLAASRELAALVSEADLAQGSLYPPLASVRDISVKIAAAVANYAFEKGIAGIERPADTEAAVRAFMYQPD
ncbi:MAG: malate dehydrogenase [Burkholderia sp.]|jgi:malate dehydrogenase (oxaloacetate-decarboxylating)(NADP+)